MPFSKINKTYTIWFILFIGAVFRFLFLRFPYWGLEYEDSYIFSATARILNESYDFSFDPFYTKYITFGSIKEIAKMGTISGHFIFFPILLAGIDKIISYSPYNVLYVNALISLVGIFFLLKTYILINSNKGLLIFGLIIASIPFLAIYNTTGLLETFSSLFISLSLYTGFRAKRSGYTKWWDCFIYVITLSVSIYIKRDNLILLILPGFELAYAIIKRDTKLTRRLIIVTITILAIAASSNFILDVEKTILDETNDIGRSPFGVDLFIQIFPAFIKALFDFKYFSLVGIIIAISLILAIRKKDLALIPLLLIFLSYLFIYSSHYRSYYMIHGDFKPSTFDTFRYYTNFISVIMLYSVSIIIKYWGELIKTNLKMIITFLIIILGINLYNNYTTREMYSEEEYVVRFQPVLKTLALTKENDIIVTDLPIMFQLIGPQGLTIIDLTMMEENEIGFIKKNVQTSNIYAMVDNEIDHRYKKKEIIFNQFNVTKISAVSDRYSLYKISRKD